MGKKKVLVIDDEQIVLDSISRVLSDENYEVDVCLKGCDGLDRAIQRDYDIVFTDILMPDIDGIMVLKYIKQSKPSLPVIIITGYAKIQSARQAMKLGAADYLEKPFIPEKVIKAVGSALDTASARPSEEQDTAHKEEMVKVLEKGACDKAFIFDLLNHGADTLDGYDLSGLEKLAILTGDVEWIEGKVGSLTPPQRRWLELRKNSEVW
jgi:DNA-binding NtrC family response regulator